jgi:hypothetical protein
MFKCKKCGKKIADGEKMYSVGKEFVCDACHNTQSELSTAEKLLWLAVLDCLRDEGETKDKEIAELKAENERLNTNLNNFIEELAWRDVQLAAWESGMWNEACGQPSRSAISTYRKSYDKLYSE